MSVNSADSARVNRVLTTTLDRYSKTISNELARNDGILQVFGMRKRIKMASGGQRAVETLDVSENSTFAARSHLADVPTGFQNSRREAKYAWATVSGSVTLNDVEAAMNSGQWKIHDLMGAEVGNAKETMKRVLADQLRKAVPGDNDPESIQTLVENSAQASQTGSPGGISRATETYWRNQYSNTAFDLSTAAGYTAFLSFMLQNVKKGSGAIDRPDFGLTPGTIWASLGGGANGDANRRYFGKNQKLLDLGFDNIVVNGMTVIDDPNITSGDFYLFNTNFMHLQVLQTGNMKDVGRNPQSMPVSIRPFMTDPKSLNKVAVMYITYAFTMSSGQRQGIATNCS